MLQISNLTLYRKTLEKEHTKLKASIRKATIKIREVNGIENRKISKAKSWILEKLTKLMKV